MKWLNDYKIKLMFFVFTAAMVLDGGNAKADFTFGPITNLGSPVNSGCQDGGASLSADGLTLFFDSDRPDLGDWDLFVSTRETLDDNWSEPVNLGPKVNRPNSSEFDASISTDGLELYFSRDQDLYVTTRETTDGEWCTAVSLGETVNSSSKDQMPSISADGLSLYFRSDRPGGEGGTDLYVTTRLTRNDAWGEPDNLGSTVNSSSDDFAPSVTSDGLSLIFSSKRPGKYSSYADLWVTTRRTTSDSWREPINLGPIINTDDVDYAGISPLDETTLFLTCFKRPDGYGYYDIWEASIIPIVDFNSDGIVDIDDLVIMIENWGTSESLCDIGPMPWGDGVVDMNDLEVWIEYWEQENMPEVTEELE